ncbi:MAG: RuBisCO large subunit C-terminal-like domain-containing protein [Planctomycetaceae bacterium]|nr:RuBisCO large subunit C-terminal-like domain-containing protein [Planctomycetaceae bacterium]
MEMEFVTATYRLGCTSAEADSVARQIALEQTVEIPEELLDSKRIRDDIVGRVRTVGADPDIPEYQRAVIDFPADLAGPHVGQMWNLLFGNISLKRCVRLIDLELPTSLARQFRGPRYGISGLRDVLGVYGRPLLATALKPRGSTPEQLAELAAGFALGGGDFVKDDHNLVEPTFDDFRRRVDLCQTAIDQAMQTTGRICLYAPNLSPPVRELDRHVDFLVQRGICAALIAPMLLGLDTVRDLADRSPLFLMAHPTFTGAYFHDPKHGVDPGVLLGQWFRLLGCDATIFPNHGGRFTFSPEECQSIVSAARSDDGIHASCWPAPAGGMSFERLQEMAASYGADAMFLIGGALLGDSASLEQSTARFSKQISQLFPEHRLATPRGLGLVSACEMPSAPATPAGVLQKLAFQAGFRWDGRSPTAYKLNGELPFAGVSRTELVGTHGEQTAFDVRYFEIAPGGYSSREKHQHTHVILGLQGNGRLTIEGREILVSPMDLAYVPPLQVHQLHNPASEPFGFLCIVDHDRDRPQAP